MPGARSTGKFTANMAIDAGHDLHVHHMGNGVFLPECETPEGERCFTFATTGDVQGAHHRWLEHAAEAAGVCWACCEPEDGWPNREECHRCWLMWNSQQGIMPRDAPPWPGAGK